MVEILAGVVALFAFVFAVLIPCSAYRRRTLDGHMTRGDRKAFRLALLLLVLALTVMVAGCNQKVAPAAPTPVAEPEPVPGSCTCKLTYHPDESCRSATGHVWNARGWQAEACAVEDEPNAPTGGVLAAVRIEGRAYSSLERTRRYDAVPTPAEAPITCAWDQSGGITFLQEHATWVRIRLSPSGDDTLYATCRGTSGWTGSARGQRHFP